MVDDVVDGGPVVDVGGAAAVVAIVVSRAAPSPDEQAVAASSNAVTPTASAAPADRPERDDVVEWFMAPIVRSPGRTRRRAGDRTWRRPAPPAGVPLEADADVVRQADVPDRGLRYVPDVKRLERLAARLRRIDPVLVDGGLALVFGLVGVATAFDQDIHDGAGALQGGYREPSALLVVTAVVICAPIAFRRRAPLLALTISALGILVHFLVGWPEGSLPLATLLLTYTVAARCALRRAIAGLGVVATTVAVLAITDSPGLDTVGVIGVGAQFAAAWAIGLAMHNRRAAEDALVRQADERAESERQSTARVLAEERLRIAQELHDIVGHSMSVIAVQAGVGAHVLDQHPEQARAVLDTISATSRGTLAEMRRLLGMLRDGDGAPTNAPAPGLADLPRLVADVRAAGVPVTLQLDTAADGASAGLELSAYRVVQEALTNVIKHAGRPTRVDVIVRHLPDALTVEVVDDGRGPRRRTPRPARSTARVTGSSGCASASRCGAASWRWARPRVAATGSTHCSRTGTRDDDPGRGRRRPGARAQRLHDAAVRRGRPRPSSAKPATAPRRWRWPPASAPTSS